MKKEIALAIALALGSTFAFATDKAGSAADAGATGATKPPAAAASDGTKDQGAGERGTGAAGPAGATEPAASGSSSDKPIDPAATPKDEEEMKKKAQ